MIETPPDFKPTEQNRLFPRVPRTVALGIGIVLLTLAVVAFRVWWEEEYGDQGIVPTFSPLSGFPEASPTAAAAAPPLPTASPTPSEDVAAKLPAFCAEVRTVCDVGPPRKEAGEFCTEGCRFCGCMLQ